VNKTDYDKYSTVSNFPYSLFFIPVLVKNWDNVNNGILKKLGKYNILND
jgi:hypothetical protein